MSIADVYSVIEPTNARLLWKAIAIHKTNDTISLRRSTKCGEEYANNKDYNNALAYYNESGILFKN
jgi:hypothetical protein